MDTRIIYDKKILSAYYNDEKITRVCDYIGIDKIRVVLTRLNNSIKYYDTPGSDFDKIKKSKLIFDAVVSREGLRVVIKLVSRDLTGASIARIKRYLRTQISDGFGENGIRVGKCVIYMRV